MTRQQVEMVVDKLDSMGLIRKGRITGDWYTVHCPFHNNGQEKKPSCGKEEHEMAYQPRRGNANNGTQIPGRVEDAANMMGQASSGPMRGYIPPDTSRMQQPPLGAS